MWLTGIFALLAISAGLVAAWYWLRSSELRPIPIWIALGEVEPVISELSQSNDNRAGRSHD